MKRAYSVDETNIQITDYIQYTLVIFDWFSPTRVSSCCQRMSPTKYLVAYKTQRFQFFARRPLVISAQCTGRKISENYQRGNFLYKHIRTRIQTCAAWNNRSEMHNILLILFHFIFQRLFIPSICIRV